jgi:hypothetical protein
VTTTFTPAPAHWSSQLRRSPACYRRSRTCFSSQSNTVRRLVVPFVSFTDSAAPARRRDSVMISELSFWRGFFSKLLGPSCASNRRSSNANRLCGRNSAGFRQICAIFQRDNLRRHFCSSLTCPATQSGLCRPCQLCSSQRKFGNTASCSA